MFQVKAKFTVDDYSHYLFTPCVLTQWVLSLLRYDLTAGERPDRGPVSTRPRSCFNHTAPLRFASLILLTRSLPRSHPERRPHDSFVLIKPLTDKSFLSLPVV